MRTATLVTGASNGIGSAIAFSRLSKGETVINIDRAPPSELSQAVFVKADLEDLDALPSLLARLTTEYEITRVVNCAGIAIRAPLEDTDPQTFLTTMRVNVIAPTLIVKETVAAMKRNGFGRVVNISSGAALGRTMRTIYASSKGGLISATRVWALELARYGITVNAIGPGQIETDAFRKVYPAGAKATEEVIAAIPVGRIGTPADVAAATDFFLSEDAGFVTGQVLYVCGGITVGSGTT